MGATRLLRRCLLRQGFGGQGSAGAKQPRMMRISRIRAEFADATPAASTALGEINIALQPLLASLANEAQEICAFDVRTAAANQND